MFTIFAMAHGTSGSSGSRYTQAKGKIAGRNANGRMTNPGNAKSQGAFYRSLIKRGNTGITNYGAGGRNAKGTSSRNGRV